MKTLLICTDGSNYSQQACHYAAWLAKRTEVQIKILYVTDLRQFEIPAMADLSGSLGIQPFEGMIAQLQELEKAKAKFIEEQSLSVFENEGLAGRTSFHYETGLLVDVIKDFADDVDMIFLGKRGENANYAAEHLGSMLERVVRSVKVPCFVSNREYRKIDNLAIAYDGGESCRKAVDYICMQASLLEGVRIHVLGCVEGHDEDAVSERLSRAEERLNAAGITPVCEMLSGVVESAIADYVVDTDIDLLVLGAYGHSRIRELLIGSTTTELLRRCHVPVLCFR